MLVLLSACALVAGIRRGLEVDVGTDSQKFFPHFQSAEPSAAAEGEKILGAFGGINGCVFLDSLPAPMGQLATFNWTWLESLNCPVVRGTDGDGRPWTGTRAVSKNNRNMCPGSSGNVGDFLDGLPVTFTSPVDCSFNSDGSDFLFTLNNGSKVRAQCATVRPADENNEMQTILTFGNYFFPKFTTDITVYPVKLEIDGHSISLLPRKGGRLNAHGLSFEATEERNDMRYAHKTSHLRMVQAHLEKLPDTSTDLNGEGQEAVMGAPSFPNSCKDLFPQATHRVQIILSGGGTVDGVRGLQPLMDKDDVFHLYLKDGTRLPADKVLGLADLGSTLHGADDYTTDLDNFYDVCLRDDSKNQFGSLAKVRMPCDPGTRGALYPPCGNKNCHPCQAHDIEILNEGDELYGRNDNMLATNANCGVFQTCGGRKGDRVSSGGFMDDCAEQDFDYVCDVDGIPCMNYRCFPIAGCSLLNATVLASLIGADLPANVALDTECVPPIAGPQLHYIKGGGADGQEWFRQGSPCGTGCHQFVRLKALSEDFMSGCESVGGCMPCSMENIQKAVKENKARVVECPKEQQGYVTSNDGAGWRGECDRCEVPDRSVEGRTLWIEEHSAAYNWQLPDILPYMNLPQRSEVYTGKVYS